MRRSRNQDTERRAPPARKSAAVFSYYSSRNESDVSRARYEPSAAQKTGIERLRHLPTVIALIVIVLCLGYTSLLNSSPRLIIVATESGKPLQRADSVYSGFITSEFEKSILNKSKLTFNAQPTVSALQKQFPEVDNAVVTLPFIGHRPVVHIAVSSPAFILATHSGAYYLSANGVPLVRVSEVKNQIQGLATVSDESNIPINPGQQALPTDTVSFITGLIQQLQATNTEIDSLSLPQAANEVQLRLKEQPYYVRFNTLQDARTQVGTFLAVKERLEGGKDQPKEYIDVRVEERAYYK